MGGFGVGVMAADNEKYGAFRLRFTDYGKLRTFQSIVKNELA